MELEQAKARNRSNFRKIHFLSEKRTACRDDLYQSYAPLIRKDQGLTRKLVSYQGNKERPGLRWMKYKEGFSSDLVRSLLGQTEAKKVLDPFSGIGTTALTAASMGCRSTGIEIMPVGTMVAKAIVHSANGLDADKFKSAGKRLLDRIAEKQTAPDFCFPHVAITQKAFSSATERDLAKAREFISRVKDPSLAATLNVACMSVLENISYTRKDGQYLRWDSRSGRTLRSGVHKGRIPTLREALTVRLGQIAEDMPLLKERYGGKYSPTFVDGSCLAVLRKMRRHAFDAVVTSPPYANRYDYTRTYALELAYLGYDANRFKDMRQALLSATVENRPKKEWLQKIYGRSPRMARTYAMVSEQKALKEVIGILRDQETALSNPHVIRLLENYFLEMAIVIAEFGRLVRPGGSVFLINDNVQYHGQEVPVDLILSDFAEQSGFRCQTIRTLPRGKGNASQQMGQFGRREIRKCVYHWVKPDG